jgi:hypothetical protein
MAHHAISGLDFIPLSAISMRRSIEETAAQNVVNPKCKNWPTITITFSVV